jgi:DNA modification methylase
MMNYESFLQSKNVHAAPIDLKTGFYPPDKMKLWQAIVTSISLERVRSAIFADTGLGKTLMQLAWADAVKKKHGNVIIFAPLAVAAQTIREGQKFGIQVEYAKDQSEVQDGITITNYERLELFDLSTFQGVVLDESSILKNYAGKTKKLLIDLCAVVPYRLCCTATPAPNDHVELGNHAEFLGIMTATHMLSRWFTNSTTNAGEWTLKAHGALEFWQWVASWAVCIGKPSDLPNPSGEPYSDEGYNLPPLTVTEHVIQVDETENVADDALFRSTIINATTMHQEMRLTKDARAAKVAELIALEPDETWVIWVETDYEADAVRAVIPGIVEVRGSDSPESKTAKLEAFSRGEIKYLLTKPSIAGWGLNWQHCARTCFMGLSYSFEKFYQALRRFYRFGQLRPVCAHVVCAATEISVRDTVKTKQESHARLQREMIEAMRLPSSEAFKVRMGDAHSKTLQGENWTLHNGDCVEVVKSIPSNSIHLNVFSPPFSSLYTYSPLWRDMGNCATHDEFFAHFNFLISELLRVTVPGRLACVHVKNLVRYKSKTGQAGIYDFRGDVIRAFEAAQSLEGDGTKWVYHSEVVIWTDPVREMQRTKAQGLLYKQIKQDSSFSRQGMPEYVLTFRKWTEDYQMPEPITHTPAEFPLDDWQQYASPVWFDINRTDVLNTQLARISADEKHLAPLQLEVIRRCLKLWSRPGDLVLSPFAGVGSEGYVSLEQDRKFVGIELNERYFNHAARYLREMEERSGSGLFGNLLNTNVELNTRPVFDLEMEAS